MKEARKMKRACGEPRQKKRYRKRAAQALAAGAVIAGGTQAYATPIRHDNPSGAGHFDWSHTAGQDVLNMLSNAASQPGVEGDPGVFSQVMGSSSTGVSGVGPVHNDNRVQFSTVYVSPWNPATLLVGIDAGSPIPSPIVPGVNDGFRPSAQIYSWYYYPGYPTNFSLLPEGVPTYLGVSFNPGDGTHYGWIGVVRSGQEVDAFAWGYETVPGEPIEAGAIPEPGSLAILALGAAAMVCRHRRGSKQG
jgi:hypothetical protein